MENIDRDRYVINLFTDKINKAYTELLKGKYEDRDKSYTKLEFIAFVAFSNSHDVINDDYNSEVCAKNRDAGAIELFYKARLLNQLYAETKNRWSQDTYLHKLQHFQLSEHVPHLLALDKIEQDLKELGE